MDKVEENKGIKIFFNMKNRTVEGKLWKESESSLICHFSTSAILNLSLCCRDWPVTLAPQL